MPNKPLRACAYPGCRESVRSGYCEKHRCKKQSKQLSAYRRGYTFRWAKESKAYLQQHPWCAQCERNAVHTAAVLVDHKRPHKGDPVLFWDKANWQGLCRSCHSSKTAREDGGFGNPLPPTLGRM